MILPPFNWRLPGPRVEPRSPGFQEGRSLLVADGGRRLLPRQGGDLGQLTAGGSEGTMETV